MSNEEFGGSLFSCSKCGGSAFDNVGFFVGCFVGSILQSIIVSLLLAGKTSTTFFCRFPSTS